MPKNTSITDRLKQAQLIRTQDELDEVIGLSLSHLVTVYVAIDLLQGRYLKDNSKLHSMDDMAASYDRYGYQAPIKFSAIAPNVEGGQGAIAYGNGRLQSATQLFEEKRDRPDGILEEDGRWFIAVTFGVEFSSPEEAIAQ